MLICWLEVFGSQKLDPESLYDLRRADGGECGGGVVSESHVSGCLDNRMLFRCLGSTMIAYWWLRRVEEASRAHGARNIPICHYVCILDSKEYRGSSARPWTPTETAL